MILLRRCSELLITFGLVFSLMVSSFEASFGKGTANRAGRRGRAATIGTEEQFVAKVIGVSDGDTITVLRDACPHRVRLSDIDCPEKRQAFGQVAKTFTSDQCFGKLVAVTVQGKDRYGRLLARIQLPNGETLNRLILKSGMGWTYRRYCHNPELLAVESEARQRRAGLWSDDDVQPPWEYRKEHRQARD